MKWVRACEGQREGKALRTTPMHRRKDNIKVYVKQSFGVRIGFSGWTRECGTAAKPLGSIHTAYWEFIDLLGYCQHLKRGFFKQTVNCIFLMALLCGNRWVVTAREMWLRSLSQIWTTSDRWDDSRVHENISCYLPPKPALLKRSGRADPLQSLPNFEKPLSSLTSVTTPETFKTEIFVLYLKRTNS